MADMAGLVKAAHALVPIMLIILGLGLLGAGAYMMYQDNLIAGWKTVNGTVTASIIDVNKYARTEYTERCANYSFILDGTAYGGHSCSGNLGDADSFHPGKIVELLVNPTDPSSSWLISGSMIKEDYTPFGWFKYPFIAGGAFWLLFGLWLLYRLLRLSSA